jgi:hypothetical protein
VKWFNYRDRISTQLPNVGGAQRDPVSPFGTGWQFARVLDVQPAPDQDGKLSVLAIQGAANTLLKVRCNMKTRQTAIISVISFLVGASAAFVFLTLNDPDKATFEAINKFGWFVLCPFALILALWSGSTFWLSALSMIAGIFVGVCVRCVIPVQSNMWPITAAFWTAFFLLPVVAGALAGGLGGWCVRKIMK